MLRALYERDIVPEMIIGTSAGAINGAFIASRPQTPATADALASIWRGLRRSEIFPLRPLSGVRGFLGSSNYLVPSGALRRLIAAHLSHERLEEMPIPLHIVAVDVVTGEELLLSRGAALEAVLASAAIPAMLPPIRWQDRELIDGGVANNTPISQAVNLGAREIYVLPTGHACALERSPGSVLGMAFHALSLLTQSRLVADIELHRDRIKMVVLPPPCPLAIQPVNFAHADELIARSLADARAFLDDGGATRPPIRMRAHRHARHRVRKCLAATHIECERRHSAVDSAAISSEQRGLANLASARGEIRRS